MQGRKSQHAPPPPPSCSLCVIRFAPSMELEAVSEGKCESRKEMSCLTGSPGVRTAFAAVCDRPDEEARFVLYCYS